MREQSANYHPFADVRHCDFRVTLNTEPVGARDSATVETSNGGAALSMDELQGWCSNEKSGEGGVFSSPPYVYISFPSELNTLGVTVMFAGEIYPTKVRITGYIADATSYAARGEFTNTADALSANLAADGLRYLKIEFLEMPESGAAVTLSDIYFGIIKSFTAANIESATVVNQAGFMGASLPSQELTLVIDNSSQEFDILNAAGIYKYLQEGQSVEAECVIDDEPVFMGKYHLQSATTKSGELKTTIKASDKVPMLEKDNFTGGHTGKSTLSAMVELVLSGTGIAAEYEEGLADRAVSAAIPATTKKREALRMLAQAAQCSCWFSRDDRLHFGTLALKYPNQRTFTYDEILDTGGVTVEEKVDAVTVTAKDEYAGTSKTFGYGSGEKTVSVTNPCVSDGAAVAEWVYNCYLRQRRYKMQNRGDPALEIGDTIMGYDPYMKDFYFTIIGMTLTFDGGITITNEGVGPGKATMIFPYYSGEMFAGEVMNA